MKVYIGVSEKLYKLYLETTQVTRVGESKKTNVTAMKAIEEVVADAIRHEIHRVTYRPCRLPVSAEDALQRKSGA